MGQNPGTWAPRDCRLRHNGNCISSTHGLLFSAASQVPDVPWRRCHIFSLLKQDAHQCSCWLRVLFSWLQNTELMCFMGASSKTNLPKQPLLRLTQGAFVTCNLWKCDHKTRFKVLFKITYSSDETHQLHLFLPGPAKPHRLHIHRLKFLFQRPNHCLVFDPASKQVCNNWD